MIRLLRHHYTIAAVWALCALWTVQVGHAYVALLWAFASGSTVVFGWWHEDRKRLREHARHWALDRGSQSHGRGDEQRSKPAEQEAKS